MNNIEKSKDWFLTNQNIYKKLSEKVENIITDILIEKNIEFHQVTHRCKTLDSFTKKIEKSKYSKVEEITDIAGIRIISYVEDAIPLICEIIEENFEIDEENSLDKGKQLGLDKVGYKSVHYVAELPESRTNLTEYKKYKNLKFEIQIRTILQHSWAEIEHDRNYKFGGELPPNIQRRFKLLAGLLELADNEFNSISKEIDRYSEEVKNKTNSGDLNIPINSTSLQQFTNQFLEPIEDLLSKKGIDDSSQIVEELKNYGINSLENLNSIIPKDLLKKYLKLKLPQSPLGILRDIMIINDYKKYFEKAYDGKWGFSQDPNETAIFKEYNIDLEKLEEYS